MGVNEKNGICYPQPQTLEQRIGIANDFVERFDYAMPMVVDTMDNNADEAYAGWPERLFVVDSHGDIAYKGGVGPFGFKPDELERWLATNVGER